MGRIGIKLAFSASMVLSQFLVAAPAGAEEKWEKDQATWMKICQSRIPQYNRRRISFGYNEWAPRRAEIACRGAWATEKTLKARHAKMMLEAKFPH